MFLVEMSTRVEQWGGNLPLNVAKASVDSQPMRSSSFC